MCVLFAVGVRDFSDLELVIRQRVEQPSTVRYEGGGRVMARISLSAMMACRESESSGVELEYMEALSMAT